MSDVNSITYVDTITKVYKLLLWCQWCKSKLYDKDWHHIHGITQSHYRWQDACNMGLVYMLTPFTFTFISDQYPKLISRFKFTVYIGQCTLVSYPRKNAKSNNWYGSKFTSKRWDCRQFQKFQHRNTNQ